MKYKYYDDGSERQVQDDRLDSHVYYMADWEIQYIARFSYKDNHYSIFRLLKVNFTHSGKVTVFTDITKLITYIKVYTEKIRKVTKKLDICVMDYTVDAHIGQECNIISYQRTFNGYNESGTVSMTINSNQFKVDATNPEIIEMRS